MKKRIASVLKWAGIILIGLGIVYVILLGLSHRALSRAYAALKKDGRPMTVEAIIPPEATDTNNAALFYEAAVLRLKAEPVGEESLFSCLFRLSEEVLKGTSPDDILIASAGEEHPETFRSLLGRRAAVDALQVVEDGAARGNCRYEIDYSKGANTLLTHLEDMRPLTRILCAAACVRAHDGDVEGAWRMILTNLRLANALKTEPIVVSQLVRIVQFALVEEALSQRVLLAGLPTEDQYSSLDQALREFEDIQPFEIAMLDGERLLTGEWVFDLSPSELWKEMGGLLEDEKIGQRIRVLAAFFPPLLKLDHAAYLTIYHAYAQAVAKPSCSKDDEALWAQVTDKIDKVPDYCFLTKNLAPCFSRAKTLFISMIALARTSRVGLAALRYRQEHGEYPESLAQCSAQDFIDPFSGKPLIYRRDSSGFVVYSVGVNLTDDGGSRTRDKNGKPLDLAWRYPAVKEAE